MKKTFVGLGWARSLVLAVFAVWLSGCTLPITSERKLGGDEGAVVLKLITNGRSSFDPAETLSKLELIKDVPAGTQSSGTSTLVRTRAVTHRTTIFSGVLSPGFYSVLQAQGVGNAGSRRDMEYTFPMRGMLGRFEVKAGEVSLLGTVLVQPLEGTRFNVAYVPPDAELAETFESLFPALATQTRGRPTHSFEATQQLQRRIEMAPQIKRASALVNRFEQPERGDFYAGGKLGRVLWRKAGDRNWRESDVATWRELLSVRPYRGGLLVAGEEGLLRYSSDGRTNWVALTAPDKGLIEAAEPLPNGKVMALVRRDAEWTAYLSDDALKGNWRKLGSFPDERTRIGEPGPDRIAIAARSGNLVCVMMPTGEMQVIDGDTGLIERRSTGQVVMAFKAAQDGMLMTRGAQLPYSTLLSTDAGKTWVDLDYSRSVKAIAFVDRKKMYAVAPVSPGLISFKYGLMRSLDGGARWERTGDYPGNDVTDIHDMEVDLADSSLLAIMRDGSMLRSRDEGKTWDRDL